MLLCDYEQVLHRMQPMIITILVGWLINRYCDDCNIYYKIDVLTAYFIIWQIIYLMWKWKDLELEWPFLILQQASCCISTCITAFLFNEFIFRYFPFEFKISSLWIVSFYDM
jgi:hypothetical protein